MVLKRKKKRGVTTCEGDSRKKSIGALEEQLLREKPEEEEVSAVREKLGYTKEYIRSAALTLQWVTGERQTLIGDTELSNYIKMAKR